MAYQALYRRFRPNSFEEVVGQENVVRALKNQVKSGRVNHAYLFCGTRGTGKTTLARFFAKSINCLQHVDGSACGECSVCKKLNEANSMDIIEIDAASNNKVDEIRELRENVQYPPVNAKYKVYIIDEVHMLTESAFNALLKTLEEPPSYCVFILATTEPHKLPQTILSRCMRFDLHLIDEDKLCSLVCKIYDEIGVKYDIEAVRKIAQSGNGSARDTISLADTCSCYVNEKLTLKDVLEVLGQTSFESLSALVDAMISAKIENVLMEFDNIVKSGKNLFYFAQEMTTYFRNMVALSENANLGNLLGISSSMSKVQSEQASKLNFEQKMFAMSLFAELELNLKYSINPILSLQVALLKCVQKFGSNGASGDEGLAQKKTNVEINATESKSNTIPQSEPTQRVEQAKVEQKQSLDEKSTNDKTTTKLTARQIWGEFVMQLQNNREMILYSACDDVCDVVQEGENLALQMQSLAGFNTLNETQNKARIKTFFETHGLEVNILIKKANEGNDTQNLEEMLRTKLGDKLVIKGE